LAEEIDQLQQRDRVRVERFDRASKEYREALRRLERSELRLPAGHDRLLELAARLLPELPPGTEETA
jgi:hypothetical protein